MAVVSHERILNDPMTDIFQRAGHRSPVEGPRSVFIARHAGLALCSPDDLATSQIQRVL
jgi:hypothetical protein